MWRIIERLHKDGETEGRAVLIGGGSLLPSFFCHVTQLGKINHATLRLRTLKYVEKYMSMKTP